jgi:hypothetical protein
VSGAFTAYYTEKVDRRSNTETGSVSGTEMACAIVTMGLLSSDETGRTSCGATAREAARLEPRL